MFFDILQLAGIAFCLFTSLLIWFRFNKNNSLSGKLLGGVLFLNGFCNSFYLLIIYGVINQFPYLYKVPAPITFLIFPLSYLYVRMVLKGENKFKKIDVIHLIPFVFFAINYLPFYLMDLMDKAAYVYRITQNFELSYSGQDGLLPEWTNILGRSLSSIFYLGLQWHLIYTFFKKQKLNGSKQFTQVKKWIFHMTIIQTIYSSSLLLLYVFNALLSLDIISNLGGFLYVLWFLVNGSFLLVSCYLLWNPYLLVGLPKLTLKKKNSEQVFPIQNIDTLVKKQNIFLNPELTVYKLSKDIGVSARKISKSIGHSKFGNFNNYINELRVTYAVSKINEGYLEKYSVDALSEISGFNSKNAFYRAFKKAYGCTPLKYKKVS